MGQDAHGGCGALDQRHELADLLAQQLLGLRRPQLLPFLLLLPPHLLGGWGPLRRRLDRRFELLNRRKSLRCEVGLRRRWGGLGWDALG